MLHWQLVRALAKIERREKKDPSWGGVSFEKHKTVVISREFRGSAYGHSEWCGSCGRQLATERNLRGDNHSLW